MSVTNTQGITWASYLRSTGLAMLIWLLATVDLSAQSTVDADQPGSWQMYFFNTKFGQSRWGLQGDYQLRLWQFGGDLEQLLLRSGLTYRPAHGDALFTQGYAFVRNEAYGKSKMSSIEHRLYQEILLPQKVGRRVYLTHRFRYEQRFIDDFEMRTRFRYNLFMNIPLNKSKIEQSTFYLAFSNELFMNGERNFGGGAAVPYFDRNRFYTGLGYGLTQQLRVQLGWMEQTTNAWQKHQLQLSVHHAF
ncbi:MAG: DUF2490 domain-containing protein [Sphingobacteriaceae bacterium]|nr:DUF2490 domain-containing protein [Sphingobacteriaceae bacterium]